VSPILTAADTTEAPAFSVVIPTFQRRDVLVGSVLALAHQEDAPTFEVVVVVDGSTDGTRAALQAIETPFPLTVVEHENVGLAATRNRGAALARGRFILFLDDDMEADPHLLREHQRLHREGVDVVVGHIPIHPQSRPGFLTDAVAAWAEERAERLTHEPNLGLHDLLGGQMSIARKLFLELGGFDTRFTRGGTFGNEDLDFGRRLVDEGRRIVFSRSAVSYQRYVVTPRQYLRQWRQAGSADVTFVRKHPGDRDRVFVPRRLPRPADRLVWRHLRPVLRLAVLGATATGRSGPRLTRWFFRVRNLEYQQGIREAGGIPTSDTLRVLAYHGVSDLKGYGKLEPYGVPPGEFAWQIAFLGRHFTFVEPEEVLRFLRRESGLPKRALLLTFDDCYADLAAAVPILQRHGTPAVGFVVTGRIGGTNDWDAQLGAPPIRLLDAHGLLDLARDGFTFGSHTRTHPRFDRIDPADVPGELVGAADDLAALGLPRPSLFAYPYGISTPAVRAATEEAGYAAAFTVDTGLVRRSSDRYALPRIEILRQDTRLRFAWKVAGLRLS
jgi:glycosyltransferase involved in cell wall biosynthesis